MVGSIDEIAAVREAYVEADIDLVDQDDYIAQPADSGCRGLHLIVAYLDKPTGGQRLVEIQLRTPIQHRWAVHVEELGRRYGWALKQGEGPNEILEYLRAASQALEEQERSGAISATVARELEVSRERARDFLRRR